MELEVLPSGLKSVVCDESGLEVRVYYLECLAQATYLVSHDGAAFIVDTKSDVDAYIEELEEKKLSLKGILETHFHADFVSGHCELARRTGAVIYYGPGAASRAQFSIHELRDNEVSIMVNVTPRVQLMRPDIGRNASCALGDCSTSRPKGCFTA